MHATSNWLSTWARFRPDAEALYDVGTGRRWTYAGLHRDSLRWAARLQQAGIRPGDRVAVLAENRGETLALLFACAELGAILFPMNWRLSPAELRWQLDDCTPGVVLVDATNAGGDLGRPALSLDAGPEAEPLAGATPGSDLDAPWQLMYTSGSTGKPKGALLTHGQVHWNALNTILACDLSADSSTLTFTPLFHTGGLNCLTTPLLHRGGRVVLTPGLDVSQALHLVASERITNLMGVPTIYAMLADHPAFSDTDLSHVRDALCGGAPLGLALLERYQARGIPLRQGFGMTEVGPNCFSMPGGEALSRMRARPEDPTAGPAGSCVGLPIHHIAARIVRPDGTEAAPGEPGELWLRGPVVCAGYWNRPDATAASIVDGWFRTGDVLSRDTEGFFHVRGRMKEMYISGGENVYPAEVESAVLEHPAIAAAAVVGVPDDRWGEVGRAFVELQPGGALDAADLRAFLKQRLAGFKVPKHYLITDALPRTGSGKLDKPLLARVPLAARTLDEVST
jgi:fatty-acyl-CoA synthase